MTYNVSSGTLTMLHIHLSVCLCLRVSVCVCVSCVWFQLAVGGSADVENGQQSVSAASLVSEVEACSIYRHYLHVLINCFLLS